MRKLLVLLLCLTLSLCVLPAAAEDARETFISGDYVYVLLNDGTAEITKYRGEESALVIPSALDGHVITTIGESTFLWFSSLTSVALPNSLTTIGDMAFACCKSLSSVTFSDNLTAIGNSAFYNCDSLTSVILPNSLIIIGEYAFSDCDSLNNITLSDSLTTIGDEAFEDCDNLTSITIPDGVTSIGINPFLSCYSLTDIHVSPDHPTLATIEGVLFSKVDWRLICYPCAFTEAIYTIPEGIEIIGDWAFFDCDSLTNVTLPDSLTTIGDGVFESCNGLNSITLPEGITTIGKNPFFSCDFLTEIYVSLDHPVLETINGVLFSKVDRRLVCYPCAFAETTYDVPVGTEIIGIGAFLGCDNLYSITLPDSLTFISDSAFYACDNLSSITLPNSLTFISDSAFSKCDNLKEIIVDRNSYARQYCIEHNLPYTYADANDWLNH